MKREFSAGGVVYRKNKKQLLWLITKSSPSTMYPHSYWRLPKGWLDDIDKGKAPGELASGKRKATDEELQNAAIQEVREEGGINAKIIRKLGTNSYTFNFNNEKILKFVTFYLMEWVSDTFEGYGFETAEIAWLPFEEACKLLKNSGEKKMLVLAKESFS